MTKIYWYFQDTNVWISSCYWEKIETFQLKAVNEGEMSSKIEKVKEYLFKQKQILQHCKNLIESSRSHNDLVT